ncbi:hypothetical protein HDC92_004786 [Pedobacter sp. AK017]|uniref:hypothetical protein n=1 Tax=Pedobacter sp. AK017 TaxID=2723073 RepID=UPI0017EEB782|nr:hypothetical protein [Pedobacter sp. AK017]MBB5441081.1 hypothetical protein [Pedobacter sp. AK017]
MMTPITDLLTPLAEYSAGVKRISLDPAMMATHVSLFTALFVCWQRSGYVSPFNVNRRQLMAFSKVASIATYHKCLRELEAKGYFGYKPSYHPRLGSLVWWMEPKEPYPADRAAVAPACGGALLARLPIGDSER